MNKGSVIPRSCTPATTTLFPSSAVWAWEGVALHDVSNQLNRSVLEEENQRLLYGNPFAEKALMLLKQKRSFSVVDPEKSGWLSKLVEISKQDPNDYAVWTEIQPTETTIIAQVNARAGLTLLKEVEDFTEANSLQDYLQFANDCVKTAFGSDVQFIISKDTDPEINEEWVNIEIKVAGEVQDIIDKYDHLIELWVQHVPWPQRSMIRYSFNPT